ncbi:hypothetical protein CNY89_07355 [Amaricoccus sp. HAR-UPW-R2A-40]|nr:hypothetical protein CNY89_07355 [Amaricoccus sp. HAR-UPW-R2A-40]
MDWDALVADFAKVAALAGVALPPGAIEVQHQPAPHVPAALPAGKMAVYVFVEGAAILKVGKAGPKSSARFASQHYGFNAPSTLAKSLIKDGARGLAQDDIGNWMRGNLGRVNFLLPASLGVDVLSLLEAFLHCRLRPVFEGFASQRGAA